MRIPRPYSKSYRKKYGMQYLHFLDQERKKKRTTKRGPSMIRMIRRILCFIGWHTWSWKFQEGNTLYLNDPPPDHAVCKHCGQRYKKR